MNTIHCRQPNEESLRTAAEIIRRGGLVAFPTETVYGLGGNALDPDAARKIYAAKGRPSNNPLIIHLANAADAAQYCVADGRYLRLAEVFCPGPLTVVLPKKACIPYEVTGGLDTVAVRIPSHPIARRLIELAGVPIAAPSANLSGKPSPTSYQHIVHDLDGVVDMLIDGGECEIGLESTIIRLEENGSISLLRPGGITPEMLSPFAPGGIYVDPCVVSKLPESTQPLAPGMMYRHYAPDAPLILLEGDDEQFYRYLADRRAEGQRFGVLCYAEDHDLLQRPLSVSLGARNDYADQAHRLFACLRHFNNETIDVIYARMPDRTGIGLAVLNRLIKAAGYHVVKL